MAGGLPLSAPNSGLQYASWGLGERALGQGPHTSRAQLPASCSGRGMSSRVSSSTTVPRTMTPEAFADHPRAASWHDHLSASWTARLPPTSPMHLNSASPTVKSAPSAGTCSSFSHPSRGEGPLHPAPPPEATRASLSGRSPGGGHGNPLQYSCLENPTDGGAWQATVHRVIKHQA